MCPYQNKWKCRYCPLRDDDQVIVEACDRDGHDEEEWDMPILITRLAEESE